VVTSGHLSVMRTVTTVPTVLVRVCPAGPDANPGHPDVTPGHLDVTLGLGRPRRPRTRGLRPGERPDQTPFSGQHGTVLRQRSNRARSGLAWCLDMRS
jgi:hypothetical protein